MRDFTRCSRGLVDAYTQGVNHLARPALTYIGDAYTLGRLILTDYFTARGSLTASSAGRNP